MSWRLAMRAPNVRASSTHASIVVSPRGTNGMTSTAPIRGCSPVCCSMSMSATACSTSRSRPADTASCSPATVNTDRLWLASDVRSRRNTPGDGGQGVGEPLDDVEATAFGDVGHAFDEHLLMLAARTAAGEARARRLRCLQGRVGSRSPIHSGPHVWPEPKPPPPPRLPQALDRGDRLGLRVRDHAARAAAHRGDLPAGHAVRVRPAHDDRVPAVHPVQPAGGRLGGPAPAPPDPDRGRPRPRGGDRVHPGRLLLRRAHDLAALHRRLRQRLLHRLLRRRLPELPAVRGGARPAGGRQLQAGDHAVRGADPGAGRGRHPHRAAEGAVRDAPGLAVATSGRPPSCSGSGGRSPRSSRTTRRPTGRSRRCARRSRSACATSPATAGCGRSPPRRARPTSSATSSARS